jgi:hypothetical protein
MKANSPASYRLSIRYHSPKMLEGGALRRQSWARGARPPIKEAASVQQKSSPGGSGEDFAKKERADEFREKARSQAQRETLLFRQQTLVFQPGTPTLQPGIPLSQPGIPPLLGSWFFRLLQADSWQPGSPRAQLFRSFARTPQGARHRPGCRCIFS